MLKHDLNPAPSNGCVFTGEEEDSYNLGLHIASVFILLVVSFLGTIISVLTIRIERLRINPIIITTAKFFGSGVVLATGFIHMIPPAMEALTNPCLPDSWNTYSAYAGLFAMLAALAMQFIEFIAHQHYQAEVRPILEDQDSTNHKQNGIPLESDKRKSPTNSAQKGKATPQHLKHHHHHHHYHGAAFHDQAKANKISTYLLEFGIALHSVLIGLTLGTTTESFIPLLIAINFHQFFEAIALGAQIARLEHISWRSIILMVIFFVLTTPVGIAIGIGVHSSAYNPESVAALLVNGILDAVSGGILIYVALVNLIAAEMGPEAREFHSLSKRLKFLYFVALYAGVAAMAIIGRWAFMCTCEIFAS